MRFFYIAGRYTAKDRLTEMARKVEELAPEWQCNSSWLSAPEADYSESDTDAQRNAWATRDIQELRQAHFLFLDTLDDSSTGGREVEYGMFLARDPKGIIIIGPRRNVFHSMVTRYDSWEAYFAWLNAGSTPVRGNREGLPNW